VNDGLWRARAPARATWDAYFFIAIFPSGEFCKVWSFSGGRAHCTSSLEGLDGPPQQVALIGRGHRVERRTGDVTLTSELVRAPGIEASVEGRDPFFWIRVPRFLSYFTCTGPARITIDGTAREGFGLVEHAWGGSTPVDIARVAPQRWHWDVLSLGGTRFFGGLALGALGLGAHGAARTDDGGGLARVRRLRVAVHNWSRDGERRVPARWTGTMATRDSTLHYEARAATPASPEVEGGGFLGFTWEGRLTGRRTQTAVAGSGLPRAAGPIIQSWPRTRRARRARSSSRSRSESSSTSS
jgi:hypothetical protein